jgi:hypothetical protein
MLSGCSIFKTWTGGVRKGIDVFYIVFNNCKLRPLGRLDPNSFMRYFFNTSLWQIIVEEFQEQDFEHSGRKIFKGCGTPIEAAK